MKGVINMRVQVNLSDEMVKSIDKYSRLIGVSRSALCSVLIGQGIMGYDKSLELIDNIGNKLSDSLQGEQLMKECTKA